MRSIANCVPALALALLAPVAAAQSNLGEVLDAGARRLSAEEFKAEIVQRTIAGPTATGADLEVIYTTTGAIAGTGTTRISTEAAGAANPSLFGRGVSVNGEWRIDDSERICAGMRLSAGLSGVNLPPRCQYWFKLGDVYYISDSDTDRRAKVLRRSPKP